MGGGLGGLSTALGLARMRGVSGVQVLEAQEDVGGRMRTRYAPGCERPLYEEGAWRISQRHRRMMGLCGALRLEMLEVASEGSGALRAWLGPGGEAGGGGGRRGPGISCPRGTLSSWDAAAEELGVRGAEAEAARSGYAGLDVMAAGSDSYGVESGERGGEEATYYVPAKGMSSVCARLREEFERHARCSVHLKTRVVDVRRTGEGYMVLCEQRVGGNAFSGRSFWADAVVVAVPPSHVAQWPGVARPLAPVLAALSPVALLKVFSEAGPEFREAAGVPGAFHLKADTLGQQVISNTYPGTDFVQLAYCAGRRAEALERLRLCGDLMGPLSRELLQLLEAPGPQKRRLREALGSKPHAVHFWSEAVHVWNPGYDLDVSLKSAQACLTPHAALPRLFLCGEAFSTVQGWGEGALQTSELVVSELARTAKFVAREGGLPPPRVPRGLFPGAGASTTLMTYGGRVMDVGAWSKVHPGGEGAIKAHLGEDVTSLWDSIMHPRYALGLVFALQVGWSSVEDRDSGV